jgi:hypothetical protein
MSLKSAPYYWVVCDNCGERCEYDEFSAWADPGYAVQGAIDGEWSAQGDRHHCPECPHIADCEKCGQDAGEGASERDNYCQSCWDTLEPVTFTFPHGTQVTVDRDGTVVGSETAP